MLAPFEQCTGCMACGTICERAIEIITDDEGFLRPSVVRETCIECGKCTNICPALHPVSLERLSKPIVFACAHRDESIRLDSASGGVFFALARAVIRRQGVVFGAATTEQIRVKHIAVERQEDLSQLQQSKYVQSDIGRCLAEAKEFLEKGRTVLFSGLPCQIAGLYSYLSRDYDQLYTVDVLCKGAPSPGVFETFIKSMQKHFGRPIRSYSFRAKRPGRSAAISVLTFADGTQREIPLTQTSFGSGFSTNLFLRPSCYRCMYRNVDRIGDISLGDFWGLGCDASMHRDRNKGVSLALINSSKGRSLFDSVSGDVLIEERMLDEAVAHNSALRGRPVKWRWRALFFTFYRRFPKTALAMFTWPHRTVVRLRNALGTIVRRRRRR